MDFCFIRKLPIAVGLYILSFSAFCDVSIPNIPGWIVMANSPDGENVFYGKLDTLKIDAQGARVLTQLVGKTSGQVTYSVVTISREACNAGYGTITLHDLSGGQNSSADYVKGGSSMGANIGDLLCQVIDNVRKRSGK